MSLKEKTIVTGVVIGAVVLTVLILGLSYQILVLNSQKEIAKIGLEKIVMENKSDEANDKKTTECLDKAKDTYTTRWNEACKRKGDKDKCALPPEQAKFYDSVYKDLRSECISRYK
jgi:hypothetical protein